MVVKCKSCNREFNVKPSRVSRLKNGDITCSMQCSSDLRRITMTGTKNHQHGLRGHLNDSFKNKDIRNNYGYILEYCPGHPRPHDKSSSCRVKQHRLIVERNSKMFNSDYFENIDGWIVLKKGYHVHHKDGDILNNNIENLDVLTASEHMSLHNKEQTIIRGKDGRILTMIKT